MPGGIPKRLTVRHLEAARLRVYGWKWRDIAAQLGYGESTVRHFWLAPAFRDEVERLQQQLHTELHTAFIARMVERILPRSPDDLLKALGRQDLRQLLKY